MYHNNEGRGVSCIGGESLEKIWIWSRMNWPDGLIDGRLDENGRSFGSKSTMLEAVGMLLPFVAFPERIRGKRLVFKIDNAAVLFGWASGYVKEDESASEVLKAVHYLSGVYGVVVIVQHVDRMSNDMASLADELSRKEVSRNWRAALALERAEFKKVSGPLLNWLSNPEMGGKLCKMLVANC